MSRKRDINAAKAFSCKALKRHGEPRTITLDGFEPSHAALRRMGMRNEFNFRWENPVTICCCQYLNNLIEQDHRRIKSRSAANALRVSTTCWQLDGHSQVATEPTRATPLHMAARRGYTEIARTLLDCGADISVRDRKGDTPMQRAVNCIRDKTARLLAERAKGGLP